MGKICLNDMNFYSHHGCYEEERNVGTNFKVDLIIEYDSSLAEESDRIEDAVSYLDLYQLVRKEMVVPSHLLENVAKRILDTIHESFPMILSSHIKVTKLAPPLGGDIRNVSIEIERKYN